MTRVPGVVDLAITFLKQNPDDLLGIVRVHLTAEGLDVEGFFHCLSILGDDPRRCSAVPSWRCEETARLCGKGSRSIRVEK